MFWIYLEIYENHKNAYLWICEFLLCCWTIFGYFNMTTLTFLEGVLFPTLHVRLFTCMYVCHHVCTCCPESPNPGVRIHGTRVTLSCVSPHRCSEPSLGPLQEHYLLWNTELYLDSLVFSLLLIMCVHGGTHRFQKRVADPLMLNLKAVVSYHECWEPLPGPLWDQSMLLLTLFIHQGKRSLRSLASWLDGYF